MLIMYSSTCARFTKKICNAAYRAQSDNSVPKNILTKLMFFAIYNF